MELSDQDKFCMAFGKHISPKLPLLTFTQLLKELDDFKKKYVEPKKYPNGILAFKGADNNISWADCAQCDYQSWCSAHLESCPPSTIHSVKNNKNEVLTVGDTVKGDIWEFQIGRFEIVQGDIFVPMDKGLFLIENLTKVEKQPLSIAIETLQKIANWELPSTGEYWNNDCSRPVSYEANYGSNGVRDYFKRLAQSTLNQINKP